MQVVKNDLLMVFGFHSQMLASKEKALQGNVFQ